jgi:phage/plasmid-like protein (TIGR03299 family)
MYRKWIGKVEGGNMSQMVQTVTMHDLITGVAPWGTMGHNIDGAMTAADAIAKGGLDWEVETRQAYFPNPEKLAPAKDQYFIVRADRDHDNILGRVKGRWTPLQNREAFEFFDMIVAASEAVYKNVGSLNFGARVYVLAEIPGEIQVIGEDNYKKYCLISNGHDGISSVQVKFTPIHVKSLTTLITSLKDGSMKIRHSGKVVDNVKQCAELMGLQNRFYDNLSTTLQRMVEKQMLEVEANKFFEEIVGDSEDKIEKLQEIFQTNAGKGTTYGAYAAVTEYMDHYVGYKNGDTRLDNVWFKGNTQKKEKAFKKALDFVYQ